MSDNFNDILEEWKRRVDKKRVDIEAAFDKGLLKAAFFCEGEAKKNAMEMIYNIPINDKYRYKHGQTANGGYYYSRTGLYKASINSGTGDTPHSAYISNNTSYAKVIEYGSSKGVQGRPIMTNAIYNNIPQIKQILEEYLKKVCHT